jgi:hypothetical protein
VVDVYLEARLEIVETFAASLDGAAPLEQILEMETVCWPSSAVERRVVAIVRLLLPLVAMGQWAQPFA